MTRKITFRPQTISVDSPDGESIIETAVRLGLQIPADCGGMGVCGRCRVVIAGQTTAPSAEEAGLLTAGETSSGVRLACMTFPLGDVDVFLPDTGYSPTDAKAAADTAMKPGIAGSFSPEPAVKGYYVETDEPTLAHPRADAENVLDMLDTLHGITPARFSLQALKNLPDALRSSGWRLTAIVSDGREVIDVIPGQSVPIYGLALDIGSTTIAGYLLNLDNGRLVGSRSVTNPQAARGEDVLTRVSFAMADAQSPEVLRQLALGAVNGLVRELAASAGIAPNSIYNCCVVANPVMLHLFFGLPVDGLGSYPFTPAISGIDGIPAVDAGLAINRAARVFSLPIIGGFVGADMTAAILASGAVDMPGTSMVVDLGTNGELGIIKDGRIICASCATGPAFEGARISHGMRAAPGAIDKIIIDPDTLEASYREIGREGFFMPGATTGARGICGSGVLDAVAGMYDAGIIDRRGTFVKDSDSTRVRAGESGMEYVLAWAKETSGGRDITVTQGDVRAVQLAKAAICAGMRVLMREMGVTKVDRVLVAGAFGNYIDIASAKAIGLIPPDIAGTVVSIGNAAGEGAAMALASTSRRAAADGIAGRAEHVELSTHAEFNEIFMAAVDLP